MDGERPNCKCHCVPMSKNGIDGWTGKQRWMCKYKRRACSTKTYRERGGRERMKAIYDKRRAEGLCVGCGSSIVLTEALCWDCLSRREHNRAVSI